MNTKLPPQAFKTILNEGSATLEIDVYDAIGEDPWSGDGVTAKEILGQLKGFDGEAIHVRINSLGGDIYDGIAIHNLLRNCWWRRKKKRGSIVVDVDGIAASAASVIACAGDVINVASNAMMMVHNAWTIAVGDSQEMLKTAEVLDKVNNQIAITYHETAKRNGKSTTLKQIRDAMNEETWMTAEEAVEFGIATNVTKATQAAASAIGCGITDALPREAARSLCVKLFSTANASFDGTHWSAIKGLDERISEAIATGSKEALEHLFGPSGRIRFDETTPAQSGPTTEEPIMSDKILKALGARDEEQALQLIELSTSEVANGQAAAALLAKFEELTGAKGDAALGAVAAWKADHEALPTVTAERDELKGKVDARDKADADAKKTAVLDQIFNAGKATRAELELMKGNTIEYLESWLQNAAKRIPGAGEKPDDTEPQISSLGSLSEEERRHIKDLGITPEQWVAAKDFEVGDEPDDDEDDEAAAE